MSPALSGPFFAVIGARRAGEKTAPDASGEEQCRALGEELAK